MAGAKPIQIFLNQMDLWPGDGKQERRQDDLWHQGSPEISHTPQNECCGAGTSDNDHRRPADISIACHHGGEKKSSGYRHAGDPPRQSPFG